MKNEPYPITEILSSLRTAARVLSVGMMIILVLMDAIMVMWLQQPAAVTDYLILGSTGIYLFGLILAFRKPGAGGLISTLYMIAALTWVFIGSVEAGDSAGYMALYIGILVFMLPGALHLLYWYRRRKARKVDSGKDSAT